MHFLSLPLFIVLMAFSSFFSASVFAQTKSVDVVYPTAQTHQQVIALTGTIEAVQHAQLATLQSGRVAALFVDVGDEVTAGQKLLTLDATLSKLALDEARAALDVANVNLTEAQRLYDELVTLSKQQFVAQTLLAERRSQLASAKAEVTRQTSSVALQAETVKRHTLYAPFAGVISIRGADLGEWVTPQTSVLTLVQQDQLRLKLAIPQQYYRLIQTKHQAQVNILPDALNGESLSVTLTRLVAVSDQQSRTLTAYADVPANTGLIAGMSANAEIVLPSESQMLVWLPKTAIKRHPDGGNSVFAVENGMAKRVQVNIVKQQGNRVAIYQQQAGQGYVVTGVELLKDGTAVQVNRVEESAL